MGIHKIKFGAIYLLVALLAISCKKDKGSNTNNNSGSTYYSTTDTSINSTLGYGVLKKLKGIWNGPVTSTTALGNFPEWIVDFRPISANQICAKNELDTLNDIFMSFFIAKHKNHYQVGFRNGGSFSGMQRASYFLADSVSENSSQSYYRFSEIVIGKNRAYTEVIFRADSLYINSFTNRYNTLSNPTPHMTWSAKLQDTSSCQAATMLFDFPQKSLTKNFTTTFDGLKESIFFATSGSPAGDPIPESAHPYLGNATISYTFAAGYTPTPTKNVLLVITTQPLFNGFLFNQESLKTRSRYVILSASDPSHTFNYMHPGNYYVYALYDNDGNFIFNSNDWISNTNTFFTLDNKGSVNANTEINFTNP